MPISTATSIAASVSSSVSGRRAAISSAMGRPVMNDWPKSPCMSRPNWSVPKGCRRLGGRGRRAGSHPQCAQVVRGQDDQRVRLRVRDHEHLRRCLFDKIWKLPGVNRTETFLSLSASDPKVIDLDLIRMLKNP
jgi:AsnC-like helix-turn-helix protein